MDDKRTADQELWELIDAARPASDDLAQPDFARLAERNRLDPQVRAIYQRNQRLDQAIGDALQELPVPAGAVERLLAKLDAATRKTLAPPVAGNTAELPPPRTTPSREKPAIAPAAEISAAYRKVQVEPPAQGETPDAASSDAPSWKQSRAGLGALAALTVVVTLVGWIVFRPAPSALGPEEILNSDWLFAVDEAAADQTPIDKPPPAGYPVDATLSVKPTAWRRITGLLGRPHGVAYQLRSPVAQATLYVTDAEAGHGATQLGELPDNPPREKTVETGGKAMSVWRRGGLLYVLVVRGGEAEYKSFITPGGQLASHEDNSRGAVPVLTRS
jgi:hypothetical protein